MHVFVTGATGWIGSAVTAELIAAGHTVLGLARSAEAAEKLVAGGAVPLRGGLDDLEVLREGAEQTDAIVHLGFKHDFSDMATSGRTERAAVTTLLDVLEGSDRPFLLASGVTGLKPGGVATENDVNPNEGVESMRGGAERLALSYATRGVRSIAVRFAPTVHGDGDHGFIAAIAATAASVGAAGYVGDGSNHWPAVHRTDAARLVVLALEKSPAGSVVHAVGEDGVTARAIAEALGAALGVAVASITPEQSAERLGFIGTLFGADVRASSTLTQQRLDWRPTRQGLIADIEAGYYTVARAE